MTLEQLLQVESMYRAALGLGPEPRAALLKNCDPEIRSSVERMLALHDGVPETQTSTAILPMEGAMLGPYRIESRIGAGGMGMVYRATDTRLGREVAIKVAVARYSERFEREARAISTLNHPHICTVHDVGPNYLVMELLEGSTLAEEIKKEPLSTLQIAQYGAQIADALSEAHAHQIVHRDLKPANIMVARHGLKVVDFGIAKMFSQAGVTDTNAIMGTPAYMAPEQVEGREADARTDLFALGLILYEMMERRLPFPGASLGAMLASGSPVTMPPLAHNGGSAPAAALAALVARLLNRDPAQRPSSAIEVRRELTDIANQITAPPVPVPPAGIRRSYLIPAALFFLLLIAGGAWFYQRAAHRQWAIEKAIPEIERLTAESKPLEAFLTWKKAERYLPGDPRLEQLGRTFTRVVSVRSEPAGAGVSIQDYFSPEGAWLALGSTPLDHIRIPDGYFRWKILKPGATEFVAAPITEDVMQPPAGAMADTPPGMVFVPAGHFEDMIDFVGWVGYDLPAFDLDKYEVTNREYQAFVDDGGYRKQDFWKEKFVKDGKELAWSQAMDLFRDPTGRAGPSTWEGGHFPDGKGDDPVSGVSWYEAAAYAAYKGHTLPAVGQWYKAAPPEVARFSIEESNFGGRGAVPSTKSAAVGPYGTYDMTGNVREWCLNAMGTGQRFILGGAWNTQTYQAYDPEALLSFDRSPSNGIRTVRNRTPLSAAASAPVVPLSRDFSKAKPASDEVFEANKILYAYDKRPLKPELDPVVQDTADWSKQRIVIDAGYENERLPLYLFLPKNVHPPFQTVLFFPSARVNTMPSSRNLGDMEFVDYVIQSGRALVYPVYRGTYERGKNAPLPGTFDDLQQVIQQSKEVRRSMDYLETRPDIDQSRIAYLGVSQGGAYGVIFSVLDGRFKTVVLLDGGFFLGRAARGRDQADFAPRLKTPVLMVNGRYDFTFSLDRSQDPLFQMLGAPAAEKKHVIFDTPHDISLQKADLAKNVLGWLDQYLGRVN